MENFESNCSPPQKKFYYLKKYSNCAYPHKKIKFSAGGHKKIEYGTYNNTYSNTKKYNN